MLEFKEVFSEAYNTWDLERLYADLMRVTGKPLSPNAKIFLRGILCGYSRGEIGKKLNYQSKDISSTVRQTLSKEVYPAIEALLNPGQKIDWRQMQASHLLERYRKGINPCLPIAIPWKQICQDMLELRRKMILTSHPLGAARRVEDVYVPLELVERQSKPRLEQDLNPEKFSVRQQEEKTTPVTHQEFFDCVLKGQSPKSKGRRIAIIGEPGAGKTTLLQEISTKVDGIPIWIDLASLGRSDTLEEYLLHNWLKSSLSTIRRYALEAVPNVLEPTTELKQAFTELFEQEQVWLLLDGADELSAELGQPLNWVAQQLQQSGWIAKAKVVLTSRLNLWSDYGDRLGEFDTYRNLDFEPKQVTEFIDKWFAEKPEDRNKLKEDLEESGDRIKSLVRNPLRLTLLCLTWKGVGDRLPDTKAGLYQRLVRSHYEHQWKTKPEDFAQFEDEEEQDKLNQWLGELSKTALDGKDSHFQGARFRFRKSALTYFAKQFEQGNDLLKWSIKLGWLNQIGLPSVDETDADEPIYAFLHPTFQEYFAALAIVGQFRGNSLSFKELRDEIFGKYWQEKFWHEILLFVCSMIDTHLSGKLIEFLMKMYPARKVLYSEICQRFDENEDFLSKEYNDIQDFISETIGSSNLIFAADCFGQIRENYKIKEVSRKLLNTLKDIDSYMEFYINHVSGGCSISDFNYFVNTKILLIEYIAKYWRGSRSSYTYLVSEALYGNLQEFCIAAILGLAGYWLDDPNFMKDLIKIARDNPFYSMNESYEDSCESIDYLDSPRQAAMKILLIYYPNHPEVLLLLQGRAINDEDEQVRQWAAKQLRYSEGAK